MHSQNHIKSIIQWLLPVVFGAVVFKLLFWCGAEGYVLRFAGCCSLLSCDWYKTIQETYLLSKGYYAFKIL